MSFSDDDLDEYFCDSVKIVARILSYLKMLEDGNTDPEVFDSLYREAHTLKGNSFLFGFNHIGNLAHHFESSLEAMRGKRQALSLELLDGLMTLVCEMARIRMQPIENLSEQLNRVVKDLSSQLHKKIRLELEGADTELDEALLVAIKVPLMHIVRNSCDHGIEQPADRVLVGKHEEGVIRIKSYYKGAQVIVEVSDDGKGFNKNMLIEEALSRRIITSKEAKTISDKDALALIFVPGLSTAEKVTITSGRGVGMDVVKTNMESIGGTVDLSGEIGQGTVTRLKIPLALTKDSATKEELIKAIHSVTTEKRKIA